MSSIVHGPRGIARVSDEGLHLAFLNEGVEFALEGPWPALEDNEMAFVSDTILEPGVEALLDAYYHDVYIGSFHAWLDASGGLCWEDPDNG